MIGSQSGPLQVADLLTVWVAATDPTYNQPFLDAGEGNGLEVYTQGFAQFARVSQAIDVSTQALYIMPWSGQSNPPAAGEQKATVQLTFARTSLLDRPLRLGAGIVFYEEQTNDWSYTGSVPIQTGRRYTLLQDLVFLPGEMGPFTVTAQAENPGWGYNNPLIGTIQFIPQPGTGFYNTRGTLTVNVGAIPPLLPPPTIQVFLIAQNEADMFVPDHVGQYVIFTSGANAGLMARMVSFQQPQPPLRGSAVQLETFVCVESTSVTGTFTLGENVLIKNGSTLVGTGIFAKLAPLTNGRFRIGFVLTSGTMAAGNTVTGAVSTATFTIATIIYNPTYTPEVPPLLGNGGSTWRILDWVADLGLTVTNPSQPSGGLLGHLDGIAFDRNLFRSTSETDDVFRKRVHDIADVVTPNAIRRMLNRVLGGSVAWCFREVGLASLPGFFYDRTDDPNGDFYDYDTIMFTGSVTTGTFVNPSSANGFQEKVQFRDASNNVKAAGYFGRISGSQITIIRKSGQGTITFPVTLAAGDYIIGLSSGAIFTPSAIVPNNNFLQHRFQYYLDYTEFRAFFLIGLPRMDIGEFGFAYGVLPAGSASYRWNAYDSAPYLTFYDGYGAGNPAFYLGVYQAIDPIKAGGVGWDLYEEDGTCS